MSETTARTTVVGWIHSPPNTQRQNAARTSSPITPSLTVGLPIARSSAAAQAGTSSARSDLRRVDQVDEQRQGREQEDPDRQDAQQPLRPGDVDPGRLPDQLIATSRFGPRAVRKSELVTAVDAKAVHIR